MRTVVKIRWQFWVCVICFCIQSLTFLFMPMAVRYAARSGGASLVATGGVFWGSALAGWIVLFFANDRRKRYLRKRGKELKMHRRVGILTFFSNRLAAAFDILLVLCAVGWGIACIADLWRTYVPYPLLTCTMLSCYMHGMFNGRIYKLLQNKQDKKER